MEKKQCPFNKFKPCARANCGTSIQVDEGFFTCSLPFIGHELYMLASTMIDSKTEVPHGDHH